MLALIIYLLLRKERLDPENPFESKIKDKVLQLKDLQETANESIVIDTDEFFSIQTKNSDDIFSLNSFPKLESQSINRKDNISII